MYSKKHDGFKFWQSGYPRISSSIATLVGFFIGLMILSLQPTFAQNGKWTIYNTSNSYLPSNVVSCFAFDTKGNIWIGTKGGGIAKFNGTNWTVYTKNNSDLPDSVVTALAIDQQDNIFIGTNRGD